MSQDIFRTRTGQTGKDAYINELAQIRNAQRELDARRMRLAAAIKTELADSGLKVAVPIPSTRFPDATTEAPAGHAADAVELNLLDEAEGLIKQLPTDWKPSQRKSA